MADFIGDTNFLTVDLASIDGTSAEIGLPSGKTRRAALPEGEFSPGPVTIVIRPEHVRLTKETSSAALTGTLQNIVYIGTDTQYHLALSDGTAFTVRTQNRRDTSADFQQGEQLGIEIDHNTIQVLRD